MKVIIASSSPRRIDFLRKWGFDSDFENAFVEEIVFKDKPLQTCIYNALVKANKLCLIHKYSTIIGMDTVVAINGTVLGKPHDIKSNIKMIEMLSGEKHFVITGIAAVFSNTFIVNYVKTEVLFRKIRKEEINEYALTGEGLDKAGGYAVQGLASSFVTLIRGPLDNVIGIPVFAIRELLDKINKLNKNI